MKGEIYLISEPEAVILGDDMNLYRVDSADYRDRKPGDYIEIPKNARRGGTLLSGEEERRKGK
jgi:hypothetical protein